MDSTQNGRHPEPKAPTQQELFDNAPEVRRCDEVKPRLSANADFPLRTDPDPGYRAAQQDDPGGRRPALVDTTPEDGSDPVWLRRIKLVIFVLFCVELGLFLTAAPWWPSLWSENKLLETYPTLRTFLHMDFVRGAVSGLGLVDIWMGIREAIHYREN